MMPQTVRFITVGSLKESYLREAVAEYRKRLSGLCRVEEVELKEARLPEDPSPAEVQAALASEAKTILADFGSHVGKFKKILPRDYDRMLRTIAQFEEKGMNYEQALVEAFYANTKA